MIDIFLFNISSFQEIRVCFDVPLKTETGCSPPKTVPEEVSSSDSDILSEGPPKTEGEDELTLFAPTDESVDARAELGDFDFDIEEAADAATRSGIATLTETEELDVVTALNSDPPVDGRSLTSKARTCLVLNTKLSADTPLEIIDEVILLLLDGADEAEEDDPLNTELPPKLELNEELVLDVDFEVDSKLDIVDELPKEKSELRADFAESPIELAEVELGWPNRDLEMTWVPLALSTATAAACIFPNAGLPTRPPTLGSKTTSVFSGELLAGDIGS